MIASEWMWEQPGGKDLGARVVNRKVASVSIAVLHGARSVREVAKACGLSIAYTQALLCEARNQGLIDREDHRSGTLRSTLAVVS